MTRYCCITITLPESVIQVIFKNETDKINVIINAFNLKGYEFNKVGIAHTFSKEQLIIQSDLIKNAKSKMTNKVKLKVKFINNSLK